MSYHSVYGGLKYPLKRDGYAFQELNERVRVFCLTCRGHFRKGLCYLTRDHRKCSIPDCILVVHFFVVFFVYAGFSFRFFFRKRLSLLLCFALLSSGVLVSMPCGSCVTLDATGALSLSEQGFCLVFGIFGGIMMFCRWSSSHKSYFLYRVSKTERQNIYFFSTHLSFSETSIRYF